MVEAKPKAMVEALMAAKKEFKPLLKNRVNPFTKSRYADLAAVLESIEEPLAKHGFMILQPFKFDEKDRFVIETKLAYVHGDGLSTVYELPKNADSQAMGSAITYGRRYSLCALLSLAADDDDDGEASKVKPANGGAHKPEAPKKEAPAKHDEPTKKIGETYMGPIKEVIEIKRGFWAAVDPTDDKYGTSTPEHADVARTCVAKKDPVRITYRLNNAGSKIILSIEPMKKEAQNVQ